MQLARKSAPKTLISLVPMIDVMLILLVFFMVTSTYLNLDMIAVVKSSDEAPDIQTTPSGTAPLLIRLGADGIPSVRGRPQSTDALTQTIQAKLQADPLSSVIVLPSGAATTQALVSVMDTATLAGATRLRLIRLEARP